MGKAFAGSHWAVFQGASEAAIPAAVLPERATQKDGPMASSPPGCAEKRPGAAFPTQSQPLSDTPAWPPCPGLFSVQQMPLPFNLWFPNRSPYGYHLYNIKYTITPVTDTYIQIGHVHLAILRCLSNRAFSAGITVQITIGTVTTASIVCVVSSGP